MNNPVTYAIRDITDIDDESFEREMEMVDEFNNAKKRLQACADSVGLSLDKLITKAKNYADGYSTFIVTPEEHHLFDYYFWDNFETFTGIDVEEETKAGFFFCDC